jgi:hypothetical protein
VTCWRLQKNVKLSLSCYKRIVQRNFPILFWRVCRVIGSGSLSSTSPRHIFNDIERFTRFVFVIAQVVSEHILQSTVFLSKFLQGIECDLLEATKECKTVIELLRAERLDESISTTGNDVLNVYSASARLLHRVLQSVRILVCLSIFSM